MTVAIWPAAMALRSFLAASERWRRDLLTAVLAIVASTNRSLIIRRRSSVFIAPPRRSAIRSTGSNGKSPAGVIRQGFPTFKSLAVTYSCMPEGHTTIGAQHFHFRVRNGIGWFLLAIAARQTGSRTRLTFQRSISRSGIRKLLE